MHMLSSGSHLKMTLFITSNQIDWLCTVKKNKKIFALKNISGIEILIRTELFPEIVDECSFYFCPLQPKTAACIYSRMWVLVSTPGP